MTDLNPEHSHPDDAYQSHIDPEHANPRHANPKHAIAFSSEPESALLENALVA
jgi:hypothetical protein